MAVFDNARAGDMGWRPFLNARFAHAGLVALLAITTACSDDDGLSSSDRLIYGPSQAFGQGTARAFVERDAAGTTIAIGVSLSESALVGLPSTPNPGSPAATVLTLQLPAAAAATGFNHVMVDWNPNGHDPQNIYTLPHVDIHFYLITPAERNTIVPSDPQWETKAEHFPPADSIPENYVAVSSLAGIPAAEAAVPLMGIHWLDVTAPELQPPPNNEPFTATFIYGSWDGEFIFVEPMVTKAFLESLKTVPNGYTASVPVLPDVQKAGLYPSRYSIRFDHASGEYRITLEGLVEKS